MFSLSSPWCWLFWLWKSCCNTAAHTDCLIYIYDQGFFFLQCGVFGTVELGDVCACCMLLGQDSVMAHWICADQGEWLEIHKSLLVMHYYYTQTQSQTRLHALAFRLWRQTQFTSRLSSHAHPFSSIYSHSSLVMLIPETIETIENKSILANPTNFKQQSKKYVCVYMNNT